MVNQAPPTAPEPENAAASLVGTSIAGRYKVERLLGEGGMGAVYLVFHTGIRKRMALKVLRADLMTNPAVVARFEREAMAAAHFDHPNVAAAHDYGRIDEGSFYLVLEYVEGQELRAAIERAKGPLPLARALFIGRQLTSALVRASELGIVHRDLKPDNVTIERENKRTVPRRGEVLANHGLRCGTVVGPTRSMTRMAVFDGEHPSRLLAPAVPKR